jgi:hypothetical protein
MKIELIDISKLSVRENNPRLIKDHKFRALVKSIKDFPEMLKLRPIVIDKDNVILGGNMRYRACLEAKLTEVPVIYAEGYSDAQLEEFIVKDNVTFGEWDWDSLANQWDTQLLVDWGMDGFNFGTGADLLDFSNDEEEETIQDVQGVEERSSEGAKITDVGYVRFELVMLEEQKKQLLDTLNYFKSLHNCSLGEALFQLHKHFQKTKND